MRCVKKVQGFLLLLVTFVCGWALWSLQVQAGTINDSPYVSFSPDGRAWTTCAGELHDDDYEKGYTLYTGVESNLRSLEVGEHYYEYIRKGNIPVGKWTVMHESSGCIHSEITFEGAYHGIVYPSAICGGEYAPGWFGYCADCSQNVAYILMYMCEDAAKSITYIPTGMDYYYQCPHCSHLEQGVMVASHICQEISANRYKIEYRVNTEREYLGFAPEERYYMYNNATEYEGNPVTPNTRLSKMNVTVPGYEFVGWNTEADGNGTWYVDEQEIYNLTEYDSQYDSKGIITLYAQWKRSESTLQIDPAGGSYRGNSGISTYTKYAHDTLELAVGQINPPTGATVTFHVNGGNAIAPVTAEQYFVQWMASEEFGGNLVGNLYQFPEKDGTVDRLTAVYAPVAILLPEAKKANASFGGWYYNAECTRPAGNAGESIIVEADTILYAHWVELRLDSVENTVANGGKGAVDLSWSQPDTYRKSYRLYRYRSIGESDVPGTDVGTWTLIHATLDEGGSLTVAESFAFSGSVRTYTVPYSGFYTLTAAGAQGGNCGTWKGGLGGEVTGDFWLNAGDIITYTIGGQNGYNSGGEAETYGNGGGATVVYSAEQGVLMVAAGGGGATAISNGGNGGESLPGNLLDGGYMGESGMAGGGGGYKGGKAGEYIYHTHDTEICGYHEHQGDTVNGGSCYAAEEKEAICSPSKGALADEVSWACGKCGIGTYTEWHWFGCGDCGYAVSGGQEHDYYEGECDYCSASNERSPDEHTYTYRVYKFDCEKTVGYQCGKSDTVPESSKPAFGGSSYVNYRISKSYAYKHGSNEGDGYLRIASQNVGFISSLEMRGVPATDLAAPEGIVKSTVKITPVSEGNIVTVSWNRPEDNGTEYFFVVESYSMESGEKVGCSNIRMHTLKTGVEGYRYALNTSPNYSVTVGNATYQKDSRIQVSLCDVEQYLHVASVDKAGNLGKTLTIRLGSLSGEGGKPDVLIPWPVYTEQMNISQGEGVCPAEESNTFYVRCDNATPVELDFRAYIEGAATEEYQITHMFFESSREDTMAAKNIIVTPMHELSDREKITAGSALIVDTEGTPIIKPYLYTATIRSNRNKTLRVVSQFLIGEESEGKVIRVTPGASVKAKGCSVTSEATDDLLHSIYLIGDVSPPVVQGAEILDSELLVNRGEEVILHLNATDVLSGLRDFYVEIRNLDNYGSRTYVADGEGNLSLDLTEDVALLAGDFTVTVVAVDNVGNKSSEVYYVTGLGLETKVERILAPHEPIFKRGESGILSLETWGYVERVEVEFPKHLEEYNQIYEYVHTRYKTGERIQFMVPLYGIADGGYEIVVKVYKGTEQLESVKNIFVSRSVLDELRTRLR